MTMVLGKRTVLVLWNKLLGTADLLAQVRCKGESRTGVVG